MWLGLVGAPGLLIAAIAIVGLVAVTRRSEVREFASRQVARSNDERFRQLAENIQEAFWLTDPTSTTTLYISPAYERIFGRSCRQRYADARDWQHALHPEDLERMQAITATMPTEPRHQTFRIIRDDKVRSLHTSEFPVRDAAGTVIRIAGVAEDITEKLELEEQVRQTQKLESLGLLAGGVAHDFNNVLAVIGANTGMLAESIPIADENRELVDDIQHAVERASSLTRQLLAFSRRQVAEPVVLDLNLAIGETRKMLRRMVGEDIAITTSLEPELGCARIDPGHFVQILMNLAVNARDAMPRGGTLAITTRNLGSEVIIEVSDTGTGMPPEVKARVFEPFFTTKGLGKGTGLGLSVVHGIVQQASGRIEIDSVVGSGTTMRIRFPVANAPAAEIGEALATAPTGAEKIVLVDDDVFVRRSTSRALRARGYTVLEAGDGVAALRLLGNHHEVDLLVTDVVMPGMGGRELVEAARASRPSLKVLYVSGYTDDVLASHLGHDTLVLEKPFHGYTLAGKVRSILDAA
jgi:two-component system cell cycle sensor histidine kinase/response regulator CckA